MIKGAVVQNVIPAKSDDFAFHTFMPCFEFQFGQLKCIVWISKLQFSFRCAFHFFRNSQFIFFPARPKKLFSQKFPDEPKDSAGNTSRWVYFIPDGPSTAQPPPAARVQGQEYHPLLGARERGLREPLSLVQHRPHPVSRGLQLPQHRNGRRHRGPQDSKSPTGFLPWRPPTMARPR